MDVNLPPPPIQGNGNQNPFHLPPPQIDNSQFQQPIPELNEYDENEEMMMNEDEEMENFLREQDLSDPWGESFNQYMIKGIKKINKYLSTEQGYLNNNHKEFIDTLTKIKSSWKNEDIQKKNKSSMMDEFEGRGIFENRRFELNKGNSGKAAFDLEEISGVQQGTMKQEGKEDLFEILATFNFFYAGGCLSYYKNMTERFASILNIYCFIVNQSILVLMKEIIRNISNGQIRQILASNLELTATNLPNREATIKTETFQETMSNIIAGLRTSFTKMTQLNGKNYQALQEWCLLSGMDIDPQNQELFDSYYNEGLLDRSFQLFFLEKLFSQDFDFQSEAGGKVQGNEFIINLIQQSFNVSFNQNVELHVARQSIQFKLYARMLFNFYVTFWSNFMSNMLPMLIMDFFNFTQGLSLYSECFNQPFFSAMRDLSTTDVLQDPRIQFQVKWFNSNANQQNEQEQDYLLNQNQPEFGLTEVFKFYRLDHFQRDFEPSFQHALEQLEEYTSQPSRKVILGSTFQQIFESEKEFYNLIHPTYSDQEQEEGIVTVLVEFLQQQFRIPPDITTDYLEHSIILKNHYLSLILHPFNLSDHEINWTFLTNLILKWYPINGIPSFAFYIFNTFLRPFDYKILSEFDEEALEKQLVKQAYSGSETTKTNINDMPMFTDPDLPVDLIPAEPAMTEFEHFTDNEIKQFHKDKDEILEWTGVEYKLKKDNLNFYQKQQHHPNDKSVDEKFKLPIQKLFANQQDPETLPLIFEQFILETEENKTSQLLGLNNPNNQQGQEQQSLEQVNVPGLGGPNILLHPQARQISQQRQKQLLQMLQQLQQNPIYQQNAQSFPFLSPLQLIQMQQLQQQHNQQQMRNMLPFGQFPHIRR